MSYFNTSVYIGPKTHIEMLKPPVKSIINCVVFVILLSSTDHRKKNNLLDILPYLSDRNSRDGLGYLGAFTCETFITFDQNSQTDITYRQNKPQETFVRRNAAAAKFD